MSTGTPDIRVGFGYDVHRLVPGRQLWLGGICIPYHLGLEGHSDADVLLHAVCDGLLGAAGLQDIGYHFPNTDERFRGADSKKLLAESYRLVQAQGFVVINIDAMLLAEAPKLAPHREAIQASIAAVLGISPNRVGVKAGTNEKMGFVGRGEGMAAYAVCLLHRA